MAQIWPKFGRILLPQHFPPLCWDRDISSDPTLRPDTLFQPSNCLFSWHPTIKSLELKAWYWNTLKIHLNPWFFSMCELGYLKTRPFAFPTPLPRFHKSFLIGICFFHPTLGNSVQIWLFFCRKHLRWDLGHCQPIWADQTAAVRMLRKYPSKYH